MFLGCTQQCQERTTLFQKANICFSREDPISLTILWHFKIFCFAINLMKNALRLRGRRNMFLLYQFIVAWWHPHMFNLSMLMESWMLLKKLIQRIALKEYVKILENRLIGFHAENKIRGSIPLSCLCVQY